MNYSKLLQTILDITEEMMVAGAEVSRVEDSINRMLVAYGCSEDRINVFIITANIQVTFEAPDGEIITQIRQIIRSDTNYDRLDYLNDLSRKVCNQKPDVEEIRSDFQDIMNRPTHRISVNYFGQILIAASFAVFFGGGPSEALASGVLGLAVAIVIRYLSGINFNQLAKLFIASIIAGFLAIGLTSVGIGHYADKIMIGAIMLLIPGIPLTNAVRDMLTGDIVTGLLRMFNSLLCAITIAGGFAIPMIIVGKYFVLGHTGTYLWNMGNFGTFGIPLISALLGSLGFAIFFNVRKKQLIYGSIGGMAATLIYLLMMSYTSNIFVANFAAAIFAAFYAERMAVINRAPATIFTTTSAVPLIPGGALYYSMQGLVSGSHTEFSDYGMTCITVALAISLGFVVVTLVRKYYSYVVKMK